MKKTKINTNRKGDKFYLIIGIALSLLALWAFYDSKWLFGVLWLILAIITMAKDYFRWWNWRGKDDK